MKACSDGMAEIANSKVAAERAPEPEIKAFAARMVKDHTECNDKLARVANKKGIALPTTVDAVHSASIGRLAKMSGSDFDTAYMMAQMCAHVGAICLFEHESYKGQDADFKELATEALPSLQAHAKSAFGVGGEKAEYQKFCKIQEYAKQVMNEK
jgi:putative membrane protein